MLKMRRLVLVVLVVMLGLVVVPVMAQDEGGVLTLTLSDIVVLVAALVGVVSGLAGVFAAFMRMPDPARSYAGLDQNIQMMLDARRSNLEMMTALENTVDKLGKHNRQSIKEVAEVVLAAAKWIPGQAIESGAEFVIEAVDGVPLEEKLRALEARMVAVQNAQREGGDKGPAF